MASSQDARAPGSIEAAHQFAQRLSGAKTIRRGHVVLRLTGADAGDFCFSYDGKNLVSSRELPPGAHAVELIGDSRRIWAVLNGTKDARAQFFAGAFRLRGDMKYISDLALELGILTQPI